MTLTYVYGVSPASGTAFGPSQGAAFGASGKNYSPTATGVITGVAASDALLMMGTIGGGDGGTNLQLVLATGTTADRPGATVSPAITGGINNSNPQPPLWMPFYDTTLSKTVYFVGTMRSPTGYVDQAGNPA